MKSDVYDRLRELDEFVLRNEKTLSKLDAFGPRSEVKFVVKNLILGYADFLGFYDYAIFPESLIENTEILSEMLLEKETSIQFYHDDESLNKIKKFIKEKHQSFYVFNECMGGVFILSKISTEISKSVEINTRDINPFQRKDYISIRQDNIEFSDILRCLDNGYASIYLLDENDNYYGLVPRKLIKFLIPFYNENLTYILQNFMFSNYVQYDDSLEEMREKAMAIFFNPLLEEIPVINNGKITSSLVKNRHVAIYLERISFYKLNWEIISLKLTKKYFKGRECYVSSKCSSMMEFNERFRDKIKINFLSKNIVLANTTNGMYIYTVEDVLEKHIKKYMPIVDVHKLYAELLIQTILQWASEHNIEFYFFDIKGTPPRSRLNTEKRFVSYTKGISKSTLPGNLTVMRSMDCNTENMHVIGGQRLTPGNPSNAINTIYFFGPCTVLGDWAKDSETIESYLQLYINQDRLPYRVINKGTGGTPPINALYLLISTKMKAGDAIVLFLNSKLLPEDTIIQKKNYYTLEYILNLPENCSLKPFMNLDNWAHFDEKGNQAVAEFIHKNIIKKKMCESQIRCESSEPSFSFFKKGENKNNEIEQGLKEYLTRLNDYRVNANNIGAIVMNCNPFTKGHYYLVDYARKNVDYLYVFVVEEDKSMFSFQDRFECARLNCKGFSNVGVLPSGKYIISNLTFAAYFNKEVIQDQDTTIFPVMDVRIFGQFIAPFFKIKKRFVGEEPFDKVTRLYNETMKEILSGEYGIEIIEIPRFTYYGDVVSATKVRDFIKQKNMLSFRNFVTDTTYKYLMGSL